ncbi:PREDICTED: choline transporter-like protein 1 isoform X2 [Priapulus caudatus]|nr:PREDICTED: choline transporter-like protein 1 isoform X2 [Priapulus caudatus]
MKKPRGCTDVVALMLFLLFWGGMIVIAAFSFTFGDAKRLIYGYDSYGNICGKNNTPIMNLTYSGIDMTDKKYVFFFDLWSVRESRCICVRECPPATISTRTMLEDYARESGSFLCDYDVPINDYSNQMLAPGGTKGPCPKLNVPKQLPVLNRCIPADIAEVGAEVMEDVYAFLNDNDLVQSVLMDLGNGWSLMILLSFIAVLLSLIIMVMMHWMAAVIVYLLCILAMLGSLVGTALLWFNYVIVKKKLDSTVEERTLVSWCSDETLFLTFSIVATVLTVILFLIILVMFKRMKLTVALFGEAGKVVRSMPCLLMQPLYTFLVLIAFILYWMTVMMFLNTAGAIIKDPETNETKFQKAPWLQSFWWYQVVGFLWTCEFILGCQQMVVAGAVASWYFTRDKNELKDPIGKSRCRLIIHHLGTVALGAFIITLVKLPRLILIWVQEKLKGGDSNSTCTEWCLKCCTCCLWCLEKCLIYLNHNAYTITAYEGSSFCPAAKKAFNTLFSNALQVAAINSVGDFVLFLGKLAITGFTGLIGILIFQNQPGYNYYAILVLIVCVFAFFIAHCFLSVYEMVIDTLFLCFCEDQNMNDGSSGREYYMEKSLMEFVNNSTAALKRLENPSTPRDGTAEERNSM